MTWVIKLEAPNLEIQFSINQMLNDEIEKKNFNYGKGFKKT